MLGRYIITNHAMQRYEQRTNKVKQSTKSRIIRDLKALRNKRIVIFAVSKRIHALLSHSILQTSLSLL